MQFVFFKYCKSKLCIVLSDFFLLVIVEYYRAPLSGASEAQYLVLPHGMKLAATPGNKAAVPEQDVVEEATKNINVLIPSFVTTN